MRAHAGALALSVAWMMCCLLPNPVVAASEVQSCTVSSGGNGTDGGATATMRVLFQPVTATLEVSIAYTGTNSSMGMWQSVLTAPLASLLTALRASWHNEVFSGNLRVNRTQATPTAATTPDATVRVFPSQPAAGCFATVQMTSFVTQQGTPSLTIAFALDNVIMPTTHTSLARSINVSISMENMNGTATSALSLTFVAPPTVFEGPLFGGGEQYNLLDLRGRQHVVLTREQGVGRGVEPLTDLLNLADFVGGSTETNYAARPILVSPLTGWTMVLRSSEYSEIDLTGAAVALFLNGTAMQLQFAVLPPCTPSAGNASSSCALDAVELVSSLVGRPPPLPAWSYEGVLVGMQGGTAAVLGNLSTLSALECPIAAFWLQDWTGERPLDLRQGLWWNWEWNATHYPNLTMLIATLRANNIRMMTYINPMLVDDPNAVPTNTSMYHEALAAGYFVRHGPDCALWTGYNGASMIDFTNPNATVWYQGIVERMMREGYSSGWMCDFGEAMPLDACLSDPAVDPVSYHNKYPDEWFRVNRNAVQAVGLEDEAFFFGRSAWLASQSLYSSGWAGDQLCSFDAYDGLASAVTSLITSGNSGTLFQHSDTGGYNALLWYRRTEELFLRWCEVSAFSTIFRTHDGSSPHENWQFYRTNETYVRFARYANIFAAWGSYRASLVADALRYGRPVLRAMLLHYPQDAAAFGNLTTQFLVGSDILVAPVLVEGATTVQVVMPSNACWRHVWTNQTVVTTSAVEPIVVDAPVGCPAVFVRCNSAVGDTFVGNLEARGAQTLCMNVSRF